MSQLGDVDEWTRKIGRDPEFRGAELRRAGVVQTVGSLAAAALAIVAIWGYTAGHVTLKGIDASTIAGIATLSFAATMAISASGGIQRRIILLVSELQRDGGSSSK